MQSREENSLSGQKSGVLYLTLNSGEECVAALIMNRQRNRAAAAGLFADVFKAAYFVHHIKLETETFPHSI